MVCVDVNIVLVDVSQFLDGKGYVMWYVVVLYILILNEMMFFLKNCVWYKVCDRRLS